MYFYVIYEKVQVDDVFSYARKGLSRALQREWKSSLTTKREVSDPRQKKKKQLILHPVIIYLKYPE